jgi:ABC transport system ATP-binding/permease protein
MALLSLRNVSLSYGGPKILDGIDLSIERGERVCLLGRNGEGKSSLLKLIDGTLKPDEGELNRSGVKIARLAQEVPEGRGGSVAELVAEGLESDDEHFKVDAILSRAGLDGSAAFEGLSSGMKRRVLLARTLVAQPDILLLDEPTNHLDIDAIGWLEDFLLRSAVTLIFVTHDRAFLGRLATRIVELDRGRLFDWPCDYATFLKRRDEMLAAEERQNALFDKKLAQEEVWIRKGIQARRTRNEGRVRALKALREERQARRDKQGTARVQLLDAERSGSLVVEAKGVGFRYGDKAVVRDLNVQIMRGDKVGVIGPNGSGKTTLLRLLLGQLEPQEGTIRLGTNLEVAYFDQLKTILDDEKTVQRNVSDYDMIPVNGGSRHVIGYLQDFLFTPDRARCPVKYLSGGERSRLLLAKLFTKPANVLVVDEPTNDLDVETLELLETLLIDFAGTVLLVSHDRAFLNGVATSTLAFEADGRVKEYDGGYDDYLRQRPTPVAEPATETAAKPTTVAPKERPKKLSHKERRELDDLPARIEMLEASRQELHETMSDPTFYRRDGDAIADARARLDAIEQELANAYERWELLEALAGS